MSDIEDNIKRCEKLTEPQNANWIGISNQMAIARVLARIKELEEEKQKYIVQLTDEQYRNLVDIIRKEAKQEFEQKVKDEIETLRKMLKATTEGKLQEYTPGEIILKINTLEELLGGINDMFQEWLKDFKKLKERKECLCEKSYEEIDKYYAMSLNKSKGTLQIFEHKDGSFGKLITEIPINYCPMCGRKLKEGD